MKITIPQALAWAQAGQQLVAAGVATIQNIRAWIQAQHPGLSEADLNAICDAAAAGASRHLTLAEADASTTGA